MIERGPDGPLRMRTLVIFTTVKLNLEGANIPSFKLEVTSGASWLHGAYVKLVPPVICKLRGTVCSIVRGLVEMALFNMGNASETLRKILRFGGSVGEFQFLANQL